MSQLINLLTIASIALSLFIACAFVTAFAWFTLRDKQAARIYAELKSLPESHGCYEESPMVAFQRVSFINRRRSPIEIEIETLISETEAGLK